MNALFLELRKLSSVRSLYEDGNNDYGDKERIWRFD
jgi:hypothetical protein